MSAKVKEILRLLDGIAPFDTAEEWDNVGLLAGHPDTEVDTVYCALDLNEQSLNAAIEAGAQLIVTHHPILFRGRKNLRTDDAEGRLLCALARSGLSMIAAHTNFDAAYPGVNDALAGVLGLTNVRTFDGGLRVGETGGITLEAFRARTEAALGDVVRVYGDPERTIHKVGVLGGSGADFAAAAKAAGADVFVTGEMSYHKACDWAADGLCVLEAGHRATERPAISLLADALQRAADGVQYNLRIIHEP